MKAFDKWLAENEKVWIESRGDSVEIARLSFEAAYKAGYRAALDNNPDEYYRLINDEI